MGSNSIFEILGPIMIGPSSSHTAGAERLGKAARAIAGSEFDSVAFYLHGSFASTYKGHGTDKALVAGILGMDTDDERIKNSFELAEELGVKIKFVETDLGDVHPNTVRIVFDMKDGSNVTVAGSSIGGGNIVISEIDGDKVEVDGTYPVLIIRHMDRRGMISKITFALAMGEINIATLKVTREVKGEVASTIVETDSKVPEDVINEISKIDGIVSVRALDSIS